MTIQTVAENLRKTIAGKEQHLKTLSSDLLCGDYVDRTATVATIEFLKINLDELNAILKDVEVCCEQALEASWALNPERMGR